MHCSLFPIRKIDCERGKENWNCSTYKYIYNGVVHRMGFEINQNCGCTEAILNTTIKNAIRHFTIITATKIPGPSQKNERVN